MLDICLVGCGGSMPIPNRYLTSLLCSYNGKMILIDCGEGTQVSMKMIKWGFKFIEAICFTHYHADHVVGLPGLLLTIGNAGRTEPLTILGPPGLIEVVKGLTVIAPELPYELKLVELDLKESTVNIGGFSVSTIPVEHAVPCVAYSILIKRSRKFNKELAEEKSIPMKFWNRLQKGEIINYEDKIFTPDMVLGEDRKGLKVSYATDTRPIEPLIDFIHDSDLFICEGMYGDDESLPKAINNKHMLFSEAAKLARTGKVKELWLTHYSPSLIEPALFLEETKMIYDNIVLGEDRMIKTLVFDK